MYASLKQTTTGPQVGNNKRSAENPGFQELRPRKVSNLDRLRLTSKNGTKSITKARTNDYVTYPYNLACGGRLALYTRNSFQHPLTGIRNRYDEGTPTNRVDIANYQAFMAGIDPENQFEALPQMNADKHARHFSAAGGPAIGCKLPVLNMLLLNYQMKRMPETGNKLFLPIDDTMDGVYSLGICKTSPTEQSTLTANSISMVEIHRVGHHECYNIWMRRINPKFATSVSVYEQPPIGTPLFFVMILFDLQEELINTPQWCRRNSDNTAYELLYYTNSESRQAEIVTTKDRYFWQAVPWCRGYGDTQDNPDVFKNCGGKIKEKDASGGVLIYDVPGAYWYFGLQWQLNYKNKHCCGVDFRFDNRHIEQGAVGIVRVNTKRSQPVIGPPLPNPLV